MTLDIIILCSVGSLVPCSEMQVATTNDSTVRSSGFSFQARKAVKSAHVAIENFPNVKFSFAHFTHKIYKGFFHNTDSIST